jgi:hypothetical protein
MFSFLLRILVEGTADKKADPFDRKDLAQRSTSTLQGLGMKIWPNPE